MTKEPLCAHCNKPLAEHRKYTREDYIVATGASIKHPAEINGNTYTNPILEICVGEWIGHIPMIRGEHHTWRE